MQILMTKRLRLRPFRAGDAEAMFKNWTRDERVAAYCRWSPHTSIRDTDEYLRLCMEKPNTWAITLREMDEPIGCIDVVALSAEGIPEIGYTLAYRFWGKGLMTEALQAVIGALFQQGYKQIRACHQLENPASGCVMRKCGMQYLGHGARDNIGQSVQVEWYEITDRTAPLRMIRAQAEDVTAVRQLVRNTIQCIYPHYYPAGVVQYFLDHHNEAHIRGDIALKRVYLCYGADDTLVGTVTVKGREVCRLFVIPEAQGKGYGGALLRFAEMQIGQQYDRIQLSSSLPAKQIYLHAGYQVTAYRQMKTKYNGDVLCYEEMEKHVGV